MRFDEYLASQEQRPGYLLLMEGNQNGATITGSQHHLSSDYLAASPTTTKLWSIKGSLTSGAEKKQKAFGFFGDGDPQTGHYVKASKLQNYNSPADKILTLRANAFDFNFELCWDCVERSIFPALTVVFP